MGITLKAARVNKGLTQAEAAKLMGISQDCLSNYERSKTYPDIPVLQKIERLYDVTYDELIFLPQNYGKTVNCDETLQ